MNFRTFKGFTLVETTLGLGVAAICLTAIFGLLVVGNNSNQVSIEQSNATNLLSSISVDLRAAPNPRPFGTTAQSSSTYGVTLPATTSSPGTIQASPKYIGDDGLPRSAPQDAKFQMNVWMTSSSDKRPVLARIVLSWPPSAPLETATGSVETIIALDRN